MWASIGGGVGGVVLLGLGNPRGLRRGT